jgi:hypothetical protein
MASLKDAFSFEAFNLGDMFKQIKKNPERLLLGAVDPFSSKIWGGITGKDYEPVVNEFGGPSSGSFDRAKAAGINTGISQTSHDLAKVVAGSLAGGYGASALVGGGAPTAAGVNSGGAAGAGAYTGPLGGASEGFSTTAAGAPNAAAGMDWGSIAKIGANWANSTADEQEQKVAQLAAMGPPPNIQSMMPSAPNVGATQAVAEQYQQALQRPPPMGPAAQPQYGLGLV